MKTKETYSIEVLIIDQSGGSEITNANSLIMGLSYSEKLWNKPQVKNTTKTGSIEDKSNGIQVSVTKAEIPDNTESVFYLTITSNDADKIESFRKDLLSHIKEKLGFTNIRLISDGISEKVSVELAATVLKGENAMRRFLTKYFINDSGLNWWESKAPQHVKDKVNQRKGNSSSELIDSDIILTDFYDLTDIIRTSLQEEDLKSRWEKLVQIKEKIHHNNLFTHQDLENAEKLTEDLIAFLSKKEGKVASGKAKPAKRKAVPASSKPKKEPVQKVQAENNTPKEPVNNNKQEEEAKTHLVDQNVKIKEEKPEVPKEVNGHSEKAEVPAEMNGHSEKKEEAKVEEQKSEPVAAKVEEVKKEAPAPVQEVKKPNPSPANGFSMITENDLLSELKTYESGVNGFVDLKKFVNEVLEPKGYAAGPAFSVARVLDGKGKVNIYDTKDEKGFPVKAIRVQ